MFVSVLALSAAALFVALGGWASAAGGQGQRIDRAATLKLTVDERETEHKLFTIGHARFGGVCPFDSHVAGRPVTTKVTITAVGGSIFIKGEGGGGQVLHSGESEAFTAHGAARHAPGAVTNVIAVFDTAGPSFTGVVGSYVRTAHHGPCIVSAQAAG